jgi:predicted N-acetyltransferase YhbS
MVRPSHQRRGIGTLIVRLCVMRWRVWDKRT